MMNRTLAGAVALAILAAGVPAQADDFVTVEVQAEYEEILFLIEQAITNRGLVVDHVNHVGDMLARTKGDVGGAKDIFAQANVFSFCSATISRQVMEADIRNFQFCPYAIHIYQEASEGAPVVVGYREYAPSSMRPVNDLLQQIVAESTKPY